MKNLILLLIFSLLFIFCPDETEENEQVLIKCSPPNEETGKYIILFSIIMPDKTYGRDAMLLRWDSHSGFFGGPLRGIDSLLETGGAAGSSGDGEIRIGYINQKIPCSNIENVLMFKCNPEYYINVSVDEAVKWVEAANTDRQDEMPDPTILEPFEITFECGIHIS